MPFFDPEHVTRFRHEVDTETFVVFREVALPPRYFAVSGGQRADVMFKQLDDRNGCILLIDQSVRYLGTDEAILSAFRNPPRSGWRALSVIRPAHPEVVLQQADALLGLDGQPPRTLAQESGRSRELVVKADEIASEGREAEVDDGDRFGLDLVEEARRGRLHTPLFREKETEALIRILSKAGKNAVVLVGPSGVGKTAVVEGLACAVAKGRVPEALAEARILDVNLSFLAAGATYRNEFEGRMKQLLDLARRDKDVILFLDELHTIRASGSDASQMVKSDLGRGHIRCIGATTNAEFRTIEADQALARRFQVVPVQELTPAQTIEILRTCCGRLERHHGMTIPDELLATVVDLSIRYVPDRHLPDKALDLLDEACACARLQAVRHGAEAHPVRRQKTITEIP